MVLVRFFKAIVFDFGGVVSKDRSFPYIFKKIASKYHKNTQKFKATFQENWEKAKINEIKSEIFWKNIAKYLGAEEGKVKREIMGFSKINREILNTLKKLGKKYKRGLLSNQIEDWLEGSISENNLGKYFDIIVTSYYSKKAKPDKDIYLETIKKLKSKPQEIIFIDDLERNLIPVKKMGIKTILFRNNKQLISDLRKFGVKI